MKQIEVKILDHNLNGMAKFLAMLTQRGHQITCMNDLMELHNKVIDTPPSKELLNLPHTTIKRMNYITVAITGLSTKCVSQLVRHAKRAVFISTSTQYSSFEGRDDNYVLPLEESADTEDMKAAYHEIQQTYNKLIKLGVDKDKASYLLPQGLRKALIIHANLDDWQYIISLRLCKRNTEETQKVTQLIYEEIAKIEDGKFVEGMLPRCFYGPCKEGKFCCGEPFTHKTW